MEFKELQNFMWWFALATVSSLVLTVCLGWSNMERLKELDGKVETVMQETLGGSMLNLQLARMEVEMQALRQAVIDQRSHPQTKQGE